jgi:hypothetical protein
MSFVEEKEVHEMNLSMDLIRVFKEITQKLSNSSDTLTEVNKLNRLIIQNSLMTK